MSSVSVTRTELRLLPDPRRVITKPFLPGPDVSPDGRSRAERILCRILALEESEVVSAMAGVDEGFSSRHADFDSVLERSFSRVEHHIDRPEDLSVERRRLVGAYFTHEYSIDAAALSNPSIVPAPDQAGVPPGSLRFVMSLRGIGEGHVSSIQFRSGTIDARGGIVVDQATPFATTAQRVAPVYDKVTFRAKLAEIHSFGESAARVLDALPDGFTMERLEAVIREIERLSNRDQGVLQATRTMHWLAASNYESTFAADSSLAERVLFPAGPTESHGMEDARFVRFTHDDGTVTYFATYTAFDGYRILPQLIETTDFVHFRIATLNGRGAANKGIALFPRKVDGHFVALARLDNENNHLIRSDNVHFWHERQELQAPRASWEAIQIGNCGSPIETDAGWLVITHGVGPMRRYALGAILLDLHDPARIIGRMRQPLLEPAAGERDGYVPNVVYSCGSMAFGDLLVLPYGFSDVGARIATLRLGDLLSELTREGP